MIVKKITRNEDSVFRADSSDLESELADFTDIISSVHEGDTYYICGKRLIDGEEEELKLIVVQEEDDEDDVGDILEHYV